MTKRKKKKRKKASEFKRNKWKFSHARNKEGIQNQTNSKVGCVETLGEPCVGQS